MSRDRRRRSWFSASTLRSSPMKRRRPVRLPAARRCDGAGRSPKSASSTPRTRPSSSATPSVELTPPLLVRSTLPLGEDGEDTALFLGGKIEPAGDFRNCPCAAETKSARRVDDADSDAGRDRIAQEPFGASTRSASLVFIALTL